MKWVAITIFVLIIAVGTRSWFSSLESSPSNQPAISGNQKESDPSTQVATSVSSSIFIPYWNIPSSSDDLSEYNTLIYFGVAPDSWGVMNEDLGFKNIESFIENTSGRQERLLTVRMLDDEVSLDVLEDVDLQSSVIGNSIDIAQEYGFDGIVLDLELSVIPFEDAETSVTGFVERFSEAVNTKTMTFAMTIYGDVFYRARPYDVAALSESIDHIYIMAYDFHKSRGEPGPNFPFDRRSLGEGGVQYDFQQMITDFTDLVPAEKITVVFGMYGYDWTLGKQGLPLKPAVAVPLNEIDYADCNRIVIPTEMEGSLDYARDDKCSVSIDQTSREKHILYTDDEGYDHELWYEDEESADVKTEYLMEQGIGSVGYWVWGYF
jgi:spore germination protein YaaH